jgi:hypothetical protein
VVLAPEALGAALADAIEQTGEAVGLRVERVHGIESASFVVHVETFSREVSAAVRGVLDALPAGVRLENRQEQEESTGEPHRVELYAPVHEYTYRVSGRVTGPVAGVLEVRRRLGEIQAASLDSLHMVDAAD